MTAITDEQILALNEGEVYFSETSSKYPDSGHGTQYRCGAPGLLSFARAVLALTAPAPAVPATAEMRFARADAFSDGYRQGKAEAAPAAPSTGECPYCHDCHPECLHCNGTGRALAAPSHSAPSEPTDGQITGAYWQGWCEAASWAQRDDLLADRDSQAYADAMKRRLGPIRAPIPDVKAAHPDDAAVDRFALAMKAKLAAARAKGRSGWDDPERCPVDHLSNLLHEHIPKGDPTDVANFCMMLHQRGSGIAAAPIKPEPRQAPSDAPMTESDTREDAAYWRRWNEAMQRQAPSDVPITRAMVKAAMPWLNGWQHMNAATKESNVEEALRCAIAAQAQKEPKS